MHDEIALRVKVSSVKTFLTFTLEDLTRILKFLVQRNINTWKETNFKLNSRSYIMSFSLKEQKFKKIYNKEITDLF